MCIDIVKQAQSKSYICMNENENTNWDLKDTYIRKHVWVYKNEIQLRLCISHNIHPFMHMIKDSH